MLLLEVSHNEHIQETVITSLGAVKYKALHSNIAICYMLYTLPYLLYDIWATKEKLESESE